MSLPRLVPGILRTFAACVLWLHLLPTYSKDSSEDSSEDSRKDSGKNAQEGKHVPETLKGSYGLSFDQAGTCSDFSGSYLSPSDYQVINVTEGAPDYDCDSLNFHFPNGNVGYGRARGNKIYLGKGRFVGTYYGDADKAFISFNHRDNYGIPYVWVKLDTACERINGTWQGKLDLSGVFNLGSGSILNGQFTLRQEVCKVLLEAPQGHPDWPKEEVVGAVVGRKVFTVFHTNGTIVQNSIMWPDGGVWTRKEALPPVPVAAPVNVDMGPAGPSSPLAASKMSKDAKKGDSVLHCQTYEGFKIGDHILIGEKEVHVIAGFGSIKLTVPLAQDWPSGTTVKQLSPDDPRLMALEAEMAGKEAETEATTTKQAPKPTVNPANPCAPIVQTMQKEEVHRSDGGVQTGAHREPEGSVLSRYPSTLLAVSCGLFALIGAATFARTTTAMKNWPKQKHASCEISLTQAETEAPEDRRTAMLSEDMRLLEVEEDYTTI